MKFVLSIIAFLITYLAIAYGWNNEPAHEYRKTKFQIYATLDNEEILRNESDSHWLYVLFPVAEQSLETSRIAVIDTHPTKKISGRYWVRESDTWRTTPANVTRDAGQKIQTVDMPITANIDADSRNRGYFMLSLPPQYKGKTSEVASRYVYDAKDWF